MIIRLMCLIGLQASVFAMNWNEVLESRHELFSDNSILVKQYEAVGKSEWLQKSGGNLSMHLLRLLMRKSQLLNQKKLITR